MTRDGIVKPIVHLRILCHNRVLNIRNYESNAMKFLSQEASQKLLTVFYHFICYIDTTTIFEQIKQQKKMFADLRCCNWNLNTIHIVPFLYRIEQFLLIQQKIER